MLETLRQYGAERLAEHDGAETKRLRTAHANYFLTYAEEAAPQLTGSSQDTWLRQLDEEYPNLRTAAEHLITGEEEMGPALRLFGVPRRYWYFASHDAEAVVLLTRALDRPSSDSSVWPRAAALVCKARMQGSFDYVAQDESAREAVDAARKAGDRALEAEALALLCYNAYFRGVAVDGIELGAEAVTIARELDDPVLLGQTLLQYAAAVQAQDMDAGELAYQEAISITNRSGDSVIAAALHNDYGCLLMDQKRWTEARQQLEMALRKERARNSKRVGTVLGNVGLVMLEEEDDSRAASVFTEALQISRLSGRLNDISYAIFGLAICATRTGDFDRAATLHGGVSALLDSQGSAWEDPEESYPDDMACLRTGLGSDFQRHYDAGRSMSQSEIIDLALDLSVLDQRTKTRSL